MSWDSIVSIGTAIGVFVAAWQLWENKKLSAAKFEDHFDEQYRRLSYEIPVDALIGRDLDDDVRNPAREAVYNYLDLCNEQIYLRQKNRIGKDRWQEWNAGMRQNLEKTFFCEVWNEVKDEAANSFTYLARLESEKYKTDPINWQ